MLGGNLGTLRGNYEEARQFLVRAIRHARQRRDHYILARSLRKYGDFLRNRGHLQLARDALLGALRLSEARSRNSPANLYSRLPRRSGAAKAELRCRVRTFGTGHRARAGDVHSRLARQFASRFSRAGFGSQSLRRCKDFARASRSSLQKHASETLVG
jgi:tetratricopeptide (TPR) repeat protein